MLSVYKTANDVHKAVYLTLKEAKDKLQAESTPENVADNAYLLRKASELFDDAHKEIDKFRKFLDRIGCVMVVEQAGQNLKGQFATARGDVSTAVQIPSFTENPKEYAELCEYFGVDCTPLTRIHFPAVRDHISELLAQGKNLPPVLAKYKQYQEAKLVATARRGDELDNAVAQAPYLQLGE